MEEPQPDTHPDTPETPPDTHETPPTTDPCAPEPLSAAHAAALAIACIVSVACGAVSQLMQPTVIPPPSAAAAAPAPDPVVPAVPHPVDLARAKKDPCGTLSAAQVAGLLGSDPHPRPGMINILGPSCYWYSGSDASSLSLILRIPDLKAFGGDPELLGLRNAYGSQKLYSFFLPLAPVDGHPVVAHSYGDDRRPKTEACTVELGASDSETLDVTIALLDGKPTGSDLCDSARTATGMVLASLYR
ncbi:DUF3558 family protein [Amycolatopsis sp. WGS_07]|uniref:DUF3558 family protein n=1 Tax=Amycolatopsis sp. WGS_07 TaxID=3076764 RepID=UPI00387389DB